MDENRKKIMVIGLGATVLILGGWYGISNIVLVKPVPDMQLASVGEVVDFLGDKRGLSRLSVDERRKVLLSIGTTYGAADRRADLFNEFERMAPSEKGRFVDAVFEVGKEDFLKDAETYEDLDPEEQKKFIKKKLDEYEQKREDMRSDGGGGGGEGGGGGGGGSIADLFSSVPGMPSRTQDVTKAIVAKTSPSERAKAKPFLDNLGAEMERRKQRR